MPSSSSPPIPAENITTPPRLTQLDDAFHKISDELRTQYLLAYYPSQRYSRSDFRQLRVDLTNPPAGGPFQSHYRAGYYTHKGTF